MKALLARLLAPVLGVALLLALVFAGFQWHQAAQLRSAKAEVETAFANYQTAAERNYAAALAKAAADKARADKSRQEALDAESLARQAAEADRDRLRAGNGQLQRLAADLSASLGDRARDLAAPASCAAAEARTRVLSDVVGALDDFAAGAVAAADDARIRGQLCERTFDALTQ